MTHIYVIKKSEKHGPYTDAEVISRICSGEYTSNDLAWRDGCVGAVPLSRIIALPSDDAPHPKGAANVTLDLKEMDLHRKLICWIGVLWVVFWFMPFPLPYLLETDGSFTSHVMGIIVSCLLARQLRKNVLLWFFLTLVPLVNLVAFARLFRLASMTLKEQGFRASAN